MSDSIRSQVEPECDCAYVYACYDGYGSANCRVIPFQLYEQYNMDLFALALEEGHGSELVYGIKISKEDFDSKKKFPEVIEFGKRCGLSEPKHRMAITSGFILDHRDYNPGEN